MFIVMGIMAVLMIAAAVMGGRHMMDGGHKEEPAAEARKEKAQDCPECPAELPAERQTHHKPIKNH